MMLQNTSLPFIQGVLVVNRASSTKKTVLSSQRKRVLHHTLKNCWFITKNKLLQNKLGGQQEMEGEKYTM